MLHLSAESLFSGRLDAQRVISLVPVFQTSSPSFMVAATLDYARAWLDQHGEQAIAGSLRILMNSGRHCRRGYRARPIQPDCRK
jgi:arginine/lysine/ornithine decarboxylase